MNRSRNRLAGGAIVLALVAGAALAQDRPESILPPGFNETQPSPAPADQPPPRAATPADRPQAGNLPPPPPVPQDELLGNMLADEEAGTPEPADPADPAALAAYELPAYARRSLDTVGIVAPAEGGLPPGAFSALPGRVIERLMGRLDAPIASRWMSIALRRALASQVATPAGVNGADFAAERAWLLLRMGEAQVARAMVSAVDTDNYTPKMVEAAMQAALATGDPGLICPAVRAQPALSSDRAWVMMGAICGALSGVAGEGPPQLAAARKRGVARGVDLNLAEKLVGTGTRRAAVTIEWDSVDQLTAWRYGLAVAGGVDIPEALFDTVSPRVRYWRAQAAGYPPLVRAAGAEQAAAQGVLSSAALIDLFGELDQADDAANPVVAAARTLRTAYADSDRAARIAAMRDLWDGAGGNRQRYARLLLTSHAAAALAPARDQGSDADRLIASMLAVGFDRAALRWRPVVARGSDGWAMLMLADRSGVPYGAGVARAYRGGSGDAARKRQMFFAGLAGLGLLSPASTSSLAGDLAVDIGLDNGWTRAIDGAAAANDAGTVVLLGAVGMQTTSWSGVSPAALYRIVAAMHRVGLDAEARMIAIEALTRL